MLRFVTRVLGASSSRGLSGVALVLVGVLSMTVLTGCTTTSPANPHFTPPASAQPSRPPSETPVPPPPSESQRARSGMRPLTEWEKQYRDLCELGKVEKGCQFFTDRSLRLQGIDPET